MHNNNKCMNVNIVKKVHVLQKLIIRRVKCSANSSANTVTFIVLVFSLIDNLKRDKYFIWSV